MNAKLLLLLTLFWSTLQAKTVLHVSTHPSGAEVLWQAPDAYLPVGPLTPADVTIPHDSARARVLVHKPGFRDTALLVTTRPGMVGYLTVHLRPEPMNEEVNMAMLHMRIRHDRARLWMWSSLVPAVLGSAALGIAAWQYDKAEELDAQLHRSAFRSDPDWQSTASESQSAAHNGKVWRNTGAGLATAATLMSFVGIYLYF